MNEIGVALVWCVVQVTTVSLLALAVHALLWFWRDRVGTLIASTSLAVIALLSALALSPWPRWHFADVWERQIAVLEPLMVSTVDSSRKESSADTLASS